VGGCAFFWRDARQEYLRDRRSQRPGHDHRETLRHMEDLLVGLAQLEQHTDPAHPVALTSLPWVATSSE